MYEVIATQSGWGVSYCGNVVYFKNDTMLTIEEKIAKAKAKVNDFERSGFEKRVDDSESKELLPQEEAQIEMQLNVEYLVALSELS